MMDNNMVTLTMMIIFISIIAILVLICGFCVCMRLLYKKCRNIQERPIPSFLSSIYAAERDNDDYMRWGGWLP